MAVAKFHTVVINATEVEPIVEFWKTILGVEVAHRIDPTYVWLKAQEGAAVNVAVQKVPEEKGVERNRLHIDLSVDDLDTAVRAIEAAGGSKLEEQEIEGFVWYVCQDPGGNEFCIAKGG